LFSAKISIQPNQNKNVSSFLCIYCGVGDLFMTSGVSHVLKCQLKSWKRGNFVSGSPKCSLVGGMAVRSVIDKNPDLVFQLPFASYKTCEPAVCVQSDPPVFALYLDRFNRLNSEKKFSILHLNVASLLSKSYKINEIVNLRKFDIISLNKTKIDCNSPDPIVSAFYNVIRSDRNNSGGGIMIFVKKEYIARQVIAEEAEIVFFQIELLNRATIFFVATTHMLNTLNKFLNL